jgi:hypothetical protein
MTHSDYCTVTIAPSLVFSPPVICRRAAITAAPMHACRAEHDINICKVSLSVRAHADSKSAPP